MKVYWQPSNAANSHNTHIGKLLVPFLTNIWGTAVWMFRWEGDSWPLAPGCPGGSQGALTGLSPGRKFIGVILGTTVWTDSESFIKWRSWYSTAVTGYYEWSTVAIPIAVHACLPSEPT